jgi:hypothetical protein
MGSEILRIGTVSQVQQPVKPQVSTKSVVPEISASLAIDPIAPFSPLHIELHTQHPDRPFQKEYESLQRAIRNHEPYFAHQKFAQTFEAVAIENWQFAKAWSDKLPLSYQKMFCYALLARLGNQGNVPELLEQIKKDPYIKNDPRFYPEMVVLEHYIKVPELSELVVA